MFGLGWFGTILLIIGLIVTFPIWGTVLFYAVVLVFKILEVICEFIFGIIEEGVCFWHSNPKAASSVIGVVILLTILGLAYFFR